MRPSGAKKPSRRSVGCYGIISSAHLHKLFTVPQLLRPFWQDEEDDNYQEEQDAGDVFDSDFDEDVRSLLLLLPICSIGLLIYCSFCCWSSLCSK